MNPNRKRGTFDITKILEENLSSSIQSRLSQEVPVFPTSFWGNSRNSNNIVGHCFQIYTALSSRSGHSGSPPRELPSFLLNQLLTPLEITHVRALREGRRDMGAEFSYGRAASLLTALSGSTFDIIFIGIYVLEKGYSCLPQHRTDCIPYRVHVSLWVPAPCSQVLILINYMVNQRGLQHAIFWLIFWLISLSY